MNINPVCDIPTMVVSTANLIYEMEASAAEAKELPDDKLVEIDTGGWDPSGGDSE